ncbi:MAG: tetratricopeptide repeat protein [Treponema sp.]|nr:tetratricopeptide repeat protein [Treponema sp.]
MSFPVSGGNPLRITQLAGLILLILTGVVFIVFWFSERNASRAARQQDNFILLLNEYDASLKIITGTDKEYEQLGRELDRLEKRAITLESWLSILKRHRALADLHYPYAKTYLNSIDRALKSFPSSQPLTALAAAAIIKDTAVNREAEQKLREMLNALSEPSLDELRLSAHIILGDFNSPQAAAQIDNTLSAAGGSSRSEPLFHIYSGGFEYNEDLIIDIAILAILRGDFREAATLIQTHFNSQVPVTENFIRFAAEYYYDFGDIRRSAEIFSRLDDEDALIRQADALYLAGYTGTARSIWSILASTRNENSLYNLAITSEDQSQYVHYLKELVNADPLSVKNSRQFGLIRYSRLLDHSEAMAILEPKQVQTALREISSAAVSQISDFPYIDLEICRRGSQWQEPGRQVAEAWLLLDRHQDFSGIENLYWWAAWKIFYQRYNDEAEILLNHAQRLGFNGQWVSVYRAIQLMQEGNLEMAEKILTSVPSGADEWFIYANLGRIYESQRYPVRAIEQYETAALKVKNQKTAAVIQSRIAKCFFSLGRISEAYNALENSLELDPDNVSVRFELDKRLGIWE